MTEYNLLIALLVLALVWAGVVTGLYLDAKREVKITKHVLLTLVQDKAERERFFTGFEKVLGGRLND
jgi:hypothetical protein